MEEDISVTSQETRIYDESTLPEIVITDTDEIDTTDGEEPAEDVTDSTAESQIVVMQTEPESETDLSTMTDMRDLATSTESLIEDVNIDQSEHDDSAIATDLPNTDPTESEQTVIDFNSIVSENSLTDTIEDESSEFRDEVFTDLKADFIMDTIEETSEPDSRDMSGDELLDNDEKEANDKNKDNEELTIKEDPEESTKSDVSISSERPIISSLSRHSSKSTSRSSTTDLSMKFSFAKLPKLVVSSDFDLLGVGDRVITQSNRLGTLKYLGRTRFASGMWAGIELDESSGKNDGSVGATRYFTCPATKGIFVKRDSLQKITQEHKPTNTKAAFDLHIGDEVYYVAPDKSVRIGFVRFIGLTEFASGTWVGIELHEEKGLNDGEVDGKRYFTCSDGYGIFIRVTKVKKYIENMPINLNAYRFKPQTPRGGKGYAKPQDRSARNRIGTFPGVEKKIPVRKKKSSSTAEESDVFADSLDDEEDEDESTETTSSNTQDGSSSSTSKRKVKKKKKKKKKYPMSFEQIRKTLAAFDHRMGIAEKLIMKGYAKLHDEVAECRTQLARKEEETFKDYREISINCGLRASFEGLSEPYEERRTRSLSSLNLIDRSSRESTAVENEDYHHMLALRKYSVGNQRDFGVSHEVFDRIHKSVKKNTESISELKDELVRLENEADKYEIRNIRQILELFRETINVHDGKIETLKTENTVMKSEQNSLVEEIEILKTENLALKLKQNESIEEIGTLKVEIKTMKSEKNVLMEDLEALKTDYGAIKSEQSISKEDFDMQQYTSKKDMDILKTNYASIKSERNALKEEFDILKTDFITMKLEQYTSKKDIDILKTNYASIKSERNALKEEFDILKTDFITMKLEQYTSKKDMDILKTNSASIKSDRNELMEELDTLETNHLAIKSDLHMLKTDYELMKSERSALRGEEIETLKTDTQALESEQIETSEVTRDQQEELGDDKTKIEILQEIEILQQLIEKNAEEIDIVKAEQKNIINLTCDISTAEGLLSDNFDEIQKIVAKIGDEFLVFKELQQQSAKNDLVLSADDETKNAIDALKKEVDQFKENINIRLNEKNEEIDRYDELRNTMQIFEEKMNEMKSEQSRTRSSLSENKVRTAATKSSPSTTASKASRSKSTKPTTAKGTVTKRGLGVPKEKATGSTKTDTESTEDDSKISNEKNREELEKLRAEIDLIAKTMKTHEDRRVISIKFLTDEINSLKESGNLQSERIEDISTTKVINSEATTPNIMNEIEKLKTDINSLRDNRDTKENELELKKNVSVEFVVEGTQKESTELDITRMDNDAAAIKLMFDEIKLIKEESSVTKGELRNVIESLISLEAHTKESFKSLNEKATKTTHELGGMSLHDEMTAIDELSEGHLFGQQPGQLSEQSIGYSESISDIQNHLKQLNNELELIKNGSPNEPLMMVMDELEKLKLDLNAVKEARGTIIRDIHSISHESMERDNVFLNSADEMTQEKIRELISNSVTEHLQQEILYLKEILQDDIKRVTEQINVIGDVQIEVRKYRDEMSNHSTNTVSINTLASDLENMNNDLTKISKKLDKEGESIGTIQQDIIELKETQNQITSECHPRPKTIRQGSTLGDGAKGHLKVPKGGKVSETIVDTSSPKTTRRRTSSSSSVERATSPTTPKRALTPTSPKRASTPTSPKRASTPTSPKRPVTPSKIAAKNIEPTSNKKTTRNEVSSNINDQDYVTQRKMEEMIDELKSDEERKFDGLKEEIRALKELQSTTTAVHDDTNTDNKELVEKVTRLQEALEASKEEVKGVTKLVTELDEKTFSNFNVLADDIKNIQIAMVSEKEVVRPANTFSIETRKTSRDEKEIEVGPLGVFEELQKGDDNVIVTLEDEIQLLKDSHQILMVQVAETYNRFNHDDDTSKATLNTLKDEMKKLQKEFHDHNERIEGLINLEIKVDEIKSKIDLSSQNQSLKEEGFTKMEQRIDELLKTNDKVTSNYERIEHELSELKTATGQSNPQSVGKVASGSTSKTKSRQLSKTTTEAKQNLNLPKGRKGANSKSSTSQVDSSLSEVDIKEFKDDVNSLRDGLKAFVLHEELNELFEKRSDVYFERLNAIEETVSQTKAVVELTENTTNVVQSGDSVQRSNQNEIEKIKNEINMIKENQNKFTSKEDVKKISNELKALQKSIVPPDELKKVVNSITAQEEQRAMSIRVISEEIRSLKNSQKDNASKDEINEIHQEINFLKSLERKGSFQQEDADSSSTEINLAQNSDLEEKIKIIYHDIDMLKKSKNKFNDFDDDIKFLKSSQKTHVSQDEFKKIVNSITSQVDSMSSQEEQRAISSRMFSEEIKALKESQGSFISKEVFDKIKKDVEFFQSSQRSIVSQDEFKKIVNSITSQDEQRAMSLRMFSEEIKALKEAQKDFLTSKYFKESLDNQFDVYRKELKSVKNSNEMVDIKDEIKRIFIKLTSEEERRINSNKMLTEQISSLRKSQESMIGQDEVSELVKNIISDKIGTQSVVHEELIEQSSILDVESSVDNIWDIENKSKKTLEVTEILDEIKSIKEDITKLSDSITQDTEDIKTLKENKGEYVFETKEIIKMIEELSKDKDDLKKEVENVKEEARYELDKMNTIIQNQQSNPSRNEMSTEIKYVADDMNIMKDIMEANSKDVKVLKNNIELMALNSDVKKLTEKFNSDFEDNKRELGIIFDLQAKLATKDEILKLNETIEKEKEKNADYIEKIKEEIKREKRASVSKIENQENLANGLTAATKELKYLSDDLAQLKKTSGNDKNELLASISQLNIEREFLSRNYGKIMEENEIIKKEIEILKENQVQSQGKGNHTTNNIMSELEKMYCNFRIIKSDMVIDKSEMMDYIYKLSTSSEDIDENLVKLQSHIIEGKKELVKVKNSLESLKKTEISVCQQKIDVEISKLREVNEKTMTEIDNKTVQIEELKVYSKSISEEVSALRAQEDQIKGVMTMDINEIKGSIKELLQLDFDKRTISENISSLENRTELIRKEIENLKENVLFERKNLLKNFDQFEAEQEMMNNSLVTIDQKTEKIEKDVEILKTDHLDYTTQFTKFKETIMFDQTTVLNSLDQFDVEKQCLNENIEQLEEKTNNVEKELKNMKIKQDNVISTFSMFKETFHNDRNYLLNTIGQLDTERFCLHGNIEKIEVDVNNNKQKIREISENACSKREVTAELKNMEKNLDLVRESVVVNRKEIMEYVVEVNKEVETLLGKDISKLKENHEITASHLQVFERRILSLRELILSKTNDIWGSLAEWDTERTEFNNNLEKLRNNTKKNKEELERLKNQRNDKEIEALKTRVKDIEKNIENDQEVVTRIAKQQDYLSRFIHQFSLAFFTDEDYVSIQEALITLQQNVKTLDKRSVEIHDYDWFVEKVHTLLDILNELKIDLQDVKKMENAGKKGELLSLLELNRVQQIVKDVKVNTERNNVMSNVHAIVKDHWKSVTNPQLKSKSTNAVSITEDDVFFDDKASKPSVETSTSKSVTISVSEDLTVKLDIDEEILEERIQDIEQELEVVRKLRKESTLGEVTTVRRSSALDVSFDDRSKSSLEVLKEEDKVEVDKEQEIQAIQTDFFIKEDTGIDIETPTKNESKSDARQIPMIKVENTESNDEVEDTVITGEAKVEEVADTELLDLLSDDTEYLNLIRDLQSVGDITAIEEGDKKKEPSNQNENNKLSIPQKTSRLLLSHFIKNLVDKLTQSKDFTQANIERLAEVVIQQNKALHLLNEKQEDVCKRDAAVSLINQLITDGTRIREDFEKMKHEIDRENEEMKLIRCGENKLVVLDAKFETANQKLTDHFNSLQDIIKKLCKQIVEEKIEIDALKLDQENITLLTSKFIESEVTLKGNYQKMNEIITHVHEEVQSTKDIRVSDTKTEPEINTLLETYFTAAGEFNYVENLEKINAAKEDAKLKQIEEENKKDIYQTLVELRKDIDRDNAEIEDLKEKQASLYKLKQQFIDIKNLLEDDFIKIQKIVKSVDEEIQAMKELKITTKEGTTVDQLNKSVEEIKAIVDAEIKEVKHMKTKQDKLMILKDQFRQTEMLIKKDFDTIQELIMKVDEEIEYVKEKNKKKANIDTVLLLIDRVSLNERNTYKELDMLKIMLKQEIAKTDKIKVAQTKLNDNDKLGYLSKKVDNISEEIKMNNDKLKKDVGKCNKTIKRLLEQQNGNTVLEEKLQTKINAMSQQLEMKIQDGVTNVNFETLIENQDEKLYDAIKDTYVRLNDQDEELKNSIELIIKQQKEVEKRSAKIEELISKNYGRLNEEFGTNTKSIEQKLQKEFDKRIKETIKKLRFEMIEATGETKTEFEQKIEEVVLRETKIVGLIQDNYRKFTDEVNNTNETIKTIAEKQNAIEGRQTRIEECIKNNNNKITAEIDKNNKRVNEVLKKQKEIDVREIDIEGAIMENSLKASREIEECQEKIDILINQQSDFNLTMNSCNTTLTGRVSENNEMLLREVKKNNEQIKLIMIKQKEFETRDQKVTDKLKENSKKFSADIEKNSDDIKMLTEKQSELDAREKELEDLVTENNEKIILEFEMTQKHLSNLQELASVAENAVKDNFNQVHIKIDESQIEIEKHHSEIADLKVIHKDHEKQSAELSERIQTIYSDVILDNKLIEEIQTKQNEIVENRNELNEKIDDITENIRKSFQEIEKARQITIEDISTNILNFSKRLKNTEQFILDNFNPIRDEINKNIEAIEMLNDNEERISEQISLNQSEMEKMQMELQTDTRDIQAIKDWQKENNKARLDVKQLEAHIENIENLLFLDDNMENTKLKWVLSHYQYHFDKGKAVYSPLFFTELNGYRFQLGINWLGDTKRSLGVYLYLWKDPYCQDQALPPFNVPYTLGILNKKREDNTTKVSFFGEPKPDRIEEKEGTQLELSLPKNKMRSHYKPYLLPMPSLDDYLVNDTLTIFCTFKTAVEHSGGGGGGGMQRLMSI